MGGKSRSTLSSGIAHALRGVARLEHQALCRTLLLLVFACRGEPTPPQQQQRELARTHTSLHDAAGEPDAPRDAHKRGRLGPVPTGPVKQLSVGADHACAVMADDRLTCWSDAEPSFPLGEVPSGTFRSVHVGAWSTCAQRTDGSVACFGSPRVTEKAPVGDIAELCHDLSPCVRRSDGTAACFDKGKSLSLGRVRTGSLACGTSWSCALTINGAPRCVVSDRVMAFGSEYAEPAAWKLPRGTFRSVFSGYQHGCALREDQTAICWGRDTSGETSPPPGAFTTLALGEKLSCGLRPNGSLECWGSEPGPLHPGPYIALGVTTHRDRDNSVCAVRGDHTVECWNYGE